MSQFDINVAQKEKKLTHHPWEKTIKKEFSNKIKYAHNAVENNPLYPELKIKVQGKDRVRFTVIGNRFTKEFIYCVELVNEMYKYRCKSFEAPIIRGVTSAEWPEILRNLKINCKGLTNSFQSPVAVLYNETFLGSEKELKELIKTKYTYHVSVNYAKESIAELTRLVKSSGRPFAYLHISIDDKHIGSLIFMLYADIVPNTCKNFLRRCKDYKGGYGGTPVHRVVKDGWVQCGGYNLTEAELFCENFVVPFDRRGVLAMANDGRDNHCSTQFFVLLQPASWITHKYVAFGQLVDGESTLKAIETVPTCYETPTYEIIIHKAGILNLECLDIAINPGTNHYIQNHIEDLITLGEFFVEYLMQYLFLEIEFKEFMHHEKILGLEEEEDRKKDIHATTRFIRKKEDLKKSLEKSQISIHHHIVVNNECSNNDLDDEDYVYETELESFHSVSNSGLSKVKEEKPYYLPLTDVPYPDDSDSNYDLKKFLRGDYCLESDLDTEAPKTGYDNKDKSNQKNSSQKYLPQLQ